MSQHALRAVRLTFAPRSATARALAGDPQELHIFTMKCLSEMEGEGARQRANLLWRADSVAGKPVLTIQTDSPEANFDGFAMVPGVDDVAHASDVIGRLGQRLTAGSILRFSLRANPTKTIAKRRVPITQHEELVDWLLRRGEGAFTLAREEFFPGENGPLAVAVDREGYMDVPGRGIRLSSVSYTGSLVVQDEGEFRTLLRAGVGRGKAFGFGLLQVA